MKTDKLATLLACASLCASVNGQLNFVHESETNSDIFSSEHLSNKAMATIEEFITPEVFRGAKISKVPEKPSSLPRFLKDMWHAFATYVPFLGSEGFVVMTAFTDDECNQPVFETGRNIGGCFLASDLNNNPIGSFRVSIGNSFVENTAITRMSIFDSFDCTGQVKPNITASQQYSFFSDKCMKTQYPDFGHGPVHSVSFAYDTNPWTFKLSNFFPQVRNIVDFDSYSSCDTYSPLFSDKRAILRYFMEPNVTDGVCVIENRYAGGMQSHSLKCNPATHMFESTHFYFSTYNPNSTVVPIPNISSGCTGTGYQYSTANSVCQSPVGYEYVFNPVTQGYQQVVSEKKVGPDVAFLDHGIPSNRAVYCDHHDHPANNPAPNLRWNDINTPEIENDDEIGFIRSKVHCPPFQNGVAQHGVTYSGYLNSQNYNTDFDYDTSSACVDGVDQFGNLKPFHLESGDILHVDMCDKSLQCPQTNMPLIMLAKVEVSPTEPQSGSTFNYNSLTSVQLLTSSQSPLYKTCRNGCPSFTWTAPYDVQYINGTTPVTTALQGDYVIVEACYFGQNCSGHFTYDLWRLPHN